jgi:outer membrane receptor protein involved in Fe transport
MQTSAIAGGIALLASTGAAAQTPSSASSETANAEVGDIVVTARKQNESIQSVPLSIKAFSSDDIERSGITSIADIARRTPNLTFGDFGDIKLSAPAPGLATSNFRAGAPGLATSGSPISKFGPAPVGADLKVRTDSGRRPDLELRAGAPGAPI